MDNIANLAQNLVNTVFSKTNHFGENMYNFKIEKRARRASETTEIAFAIVASLCVLFLVLAMFSDNLKTFIDHGAFPGTWNPSAQKTSAQSWQIGQKQPNRDNITAPEVQATSWDAILQKQNDKAKQNIENYYAQVQSAADPATYQLPDGDKKLLGMWFATYGNSTSAKQEVDAGANALYSTNFSGTSYSYGNFADSQNIDVETLKDGKISVAGQIISWKTNNPNWKKGLYTDEDPKSRVSNIKDEGGIYSAFK